MSGRNRFTLENTTCVLVGAQGLIGRACAQALLDCGARVLALDVRPDARIDETGPGEPVRVDLTDSQALDKFFSELRGRAKSGEFAFINASYPRTADWGQQGFEDMTLEHWNRNVELHLGSAFHFSQAAVGFLKERGGGSLLNFGSIYGEAGPDLRIYEGTPMKNPVAYAAIKSGITGMTRYIATAFGSQGIRANVLCPGGIEDGQPASFIQAYKARTPLARMGTPDDIAGAVAFLVGPAARYITGQVIRVDGGWTAW